MPGMSGMDDCWSSFWLGGCWLFSSWAEGSPGKQNKNKLRLIFLSVDCIVSSKTQQGDRTGSHNSDTRTAVRESQVAGSFRGIRFSEWQKVVRILPVGITLSDLVTGRQLLWVLPFLH